MRARTSTDPPPNGLAFAAARSCVDGRVVVRRADERRSVPGPADRERRSTGESAQSPPPEASPAVARRLSDASSNAPPPPPPPPLPPPSPSTPMRARAARSKAPYLRWRAEGGAG